MNTIDQIDTQFNDVIPLCVPEIRGNEWNYIKECLDTNWVSSVGSFVDSFEQKVADFIGSKYAVATVNGTSALHIALLIGGIKPEDEVLVSTLTFIAPVNAIRYAGAYPVFIDAEPNYWQIDSQKVRDFLEQECVWRNNNLYNKNTGRRVKAILPVHILGHAVDIDPILEIARKYNLVVIEDAAEGLGAKYKRRNVGKLADISCVSFNGNKIITTGGGGMVLTQNETWANKAKYLTTQAKDDPLEYIHHEIGFNYRLNNIQAAMGCAQIELLPSYITKKRQIAHNYTQALAHISGLESPQEATWARSTFWLYTVLIDKLKFGLSSRDTIQKLAAAKIQTRPLWQPIHLSKAHQDCQAYYCEIAEKLYRKAISLPCSVGLSESSQNRVIKTIMSLVK